MRSYYGMAAVSRTLGVGRHKISSLARQHGIGFNAGGAAGWRFSDEDVEKLVEAMRPAPLEAPAPVRRPKRRAAVAR